MATDWSAPDLNDASRFLELERWATVTLAWQQEEARRAKARRSQHLQCASAQRITARARGALAVDEPSGAAYRELLRAREGVASSRCPRAVPREAGDCVPLDQLETIAPPTAGHARRTACAGSKARRRCRWCELRRRDAVAAREAREIAKMVQPHAVGFRQHLPAQREGLRGWPAWQDGLGACLADAGPRQTCSARAARPPRQARPAARGCPTSVVMNG